MASAVVCLGAARGGTDLEGAESSARRARWLRPKALPPRAPRRRSCIGVLLKSTWEWSAMVSSGHHIRSVGGHKQVKSAYCTGTYESKLAILAIGARADRTGEIYNSQEP